MNIGSLTVTLGIDATQLAAANLAMSNFEKKTTSSLAKVNSSLQRFGYLATTALTLPLTMAGKATFQFAKDYEYAIQKIVGLTGVAQNTVNSWSKDLLAIGPQLGRTPQELADALYFISSSGIKGAEAMNVLALSAKAATAGLGDTKTVADLLTSALNAYAGTGLTAQYATDTLVAAVREGKAEASGFASAMGQIIPIAAELGVSFDEVAGGMAAITLTGSSSATAAVYLKGVFNSLLTASTKGEKALNAVGTSYEELRNILGGQGLIPLMQRLRDIQMKYGDELISDVLPNIRALTGYLSLAGKNFRYNTELMKRVTESTGSLGKAFAAVSDTIKVRYDRAISAAQVSMISLGKSIADALLPFIEKLVKKLEELTAWFNGLSESGRKTILTIAGIAAALGPLSLLASAFVWIIRGLVTIVGTASKAFTTLRAVMMSNPWIAAATAVLLAVGALVKYQKRVKDIAKEHDSFNTTLVSVNGTLKKLKDLLPIDYGSMTLNELSTAQEAARKEWVAAEKLYKQGIKNKESFSWLEKVFGANKNNEKFIKEQEDKIGILKQQYESLGDTYYDVWQKSLSEAEIKKQEKLNATLDITKQKLKEEQEALDRLNASWTEQGNLIEMSSKVGKYGWMLAEKEGDALSKKMKDMIKFVRGTFGKSNDVSLLPKVATINAPKTPEFMPSLITNTTIATVDSMTKGLIKQEEAVTVLANAFEDLFNSAGNGFQAMIDKFTEGLKKLAAEMLAKTVIWSLLNLLSKGGAGTWMDFIKGVTGVPKVSQFAGGTNYAPGGLSFVGERGPELVNLPRGSQVLPNSMLGMGRQTVEFEPVEIVIKENQMVGFLKKANNRKSLY